jgi:hypothetical protein
LWAGSNFSNIKKNSDNANVFTKKQERHETWVIHLNKYNKIG